MWNTPSPCQDDFQRFVSKHIENCAFANPTEFPNLRHDDELVLAADYSGQHSGSRFNVLTFLLADRPSVIREWDAKRKEIRLAHSMGERKHEFKKLNDGIRRRALIPFLEASKRLNGIIFSIAIDKRFEDDTLGYSFPDIPKIKSETLAKCVHVASFGSILVGGLTRDGQNLQWITDNDDIVANEEVTSIFSFIVDSIFSRMVPSGFGQLRLGVSGAFNDRFRAEDLCSIPDLVGGAMSEVINLISDDAIPRSEPGFTPLEGQLSIKSQLISMWLSTLNGPLMGRFVVVRKMENGQMQVNFTMPEFRVGPDIREGNVAPLDEKWTRVLSDWQAETESLRQQQ